MGVVEKEKNGVRVYKHGFVSVNLVDEGPEKYTVGRNRKRPKIIWAG